MQGCDVTRGGAWRLVNKRTFGNLSRGWQVQISQIFYQQAHAEMEPLAKYDTCTWLSLQYFSKVCPCILRPPKNIPYSFYGGKVISLHYQRIVPSVIWWRTRIVMKHMTTTSAFRKICFVNVLSDKHSVWEIRSKSIKPRYVLSLILAGRLARLWFLFFYLDIYLDRPNKAWTLLLNVNRSHFSM